MNNLLLTDWYWKLNQEKNFKKKTNDIEINKQAN